MSAHDKPIAIWEPMSDQTSRGETDIKENSHMRMDCHNAPCPRFSRPWRLAARRSGNRRSLGAVVAELAICLPFLVVLLAGVIQYGMILHAVSTLDQYAREAARYTAENWSNPGFNKSTSPPAGSYLYFVNQIATANNIPDSALTSWVYVPDGSGGLTAISDESCKTGCTSITPGTIFTIKVSYDMTQQYVFYGLVPGLSKPWSFTATASMVAE